MRNCGNLGPDFTKFANFFVIFVHPTELAAALAWNVPFHMAEIQANLQEGLADYAREEFFGFGVSVGNVLVLAVGTN